MLHHEKKARIIFSFCYPLFINRMLHFKSRSNKHRPFTSSSSVQQEVTFETNKLQSVQAPVFEKEHIVVKLIDYDEMHFTLYQLTSDDNYYYLYITVAGTNYDLGIIGNRNTNIDIIGNSIVQKTLIPSTDTIYELRREEEFDIITTTYFAIRESTPILLYSIPGTGKQYDVDEDGQLETVANGGMSTSPNHLLYEWNIDANEIYIADLRQQLSCDTLVFNDAEWCFVAEKKIGNEWYSGSYKYYGTYLEKIG